jgi:hypothetical protein
MKNFVLLGALLLATVSGCKKSSEPEKQVVAKDTTPTPPPAPTPATPATPAPAEGSGAGPGPTTPSVADAPVGNPPADGKYTNVKVEGVTVPMINVMEKGTVVLVDTDGKKPRSWEEQYKKKTAKLVGQFDLHKTDANKSGKFDDDEVDKQGLWVIDNQGNITKH